MGPINMRKKIDRQTNQQLKKQRLNDGTILKKKNKKSKKKTELEKNTFCLTSQHYES